MAIMAPQTTSVINGLNIWKHQAIKRAKIPIRIAISIAFSTYDFSWIISDDWVIIVSPSSSTLPEWLTDEKIRQLFSKDRLYQITFYPFTADHTISDSLFLIKMQKSGTSLIGLSDILEKPLRSNRMAIGI